MQSQLVHFGAQFGGPWQILAAGGIILSLGVASFWLAGIIRWRRGLYSGWDQFPTVSIIVVGRNEELYIRSVLHSVVSCDYVLGRLEICFVDDQSSDRTFEIAEELSREYPSLLRIVRAPDVPPGVSPKKNALTFGISQTRGDILLFTDADSVVQPGWVRAMVNEYDSKTGAVAGAALPRMAATPYELLYRLERFMAAFTSASAIGFGSPASVTGQNFSVRRRAFEDVGGYAAHHIASGDDDLMAQAIARKGWQVKFCSNPASVVTDLRPPDSRSHISAAMRHQSVLRYYPWRWRAAYLLSIMSGWVLLAGLIGILFWTEYRAALAVIVGMKFSIDAIGVSVFAQQMKIRLRPVEFLIAEVVLPLYLVVRPLFALSPNFTWRGRTHHRYRGRPIANPIHE